MQYDTHNSSKQWIPKIYCSQCEEKLTVKKIKQEFPVTETYTEQQNNTKWLTFKYCSSLVRKVTNLFKNTNLNVAFRTTNTINQQLTDKLRNTNRSGIYQRKCNTYNIPTKVQYM